MLVKETGMENTQVVLSGETPGGEYKGVAIGQADQYPQYPEAIAGQAVARLVQPRPGSPGISLISSPAAARAVRRRWFQQDQASGLLCPAAGPRYYQRGYGY